MYEDNKGYMRLTVYDNGKQINISEHQLNTLINNSLHDVYNKDNVVHHKNSCRFDNRVENLELMSVSEHNKLHNSGKNHPMYNKHHSDEAKRKIGEAQIGNKNNFNPCILIRKEKNKNYKQGYTWRADPSTKDKLKRLSSVDLDKCIKKVEEFIKSEENTKGYTSYQIKGSD